MAGLMSGLELPTTSIQTHPDTGRPEARVTSNPTTAAHKLPTPHQPAASTEPATKVAASLKEPEQSEVWERVEFSRETSINFYNREHRNGRVRGGQKSRNGRGQKRLCKKCIIK